MKRSFLLLPLALVIAAPVIAEIRKCGSVYTDRPCADATPADGNSSAEGATEPAPRSAAAKEEALVRSKKRTLLHNLVTKRLDARRDYKFDLDTSEADEVCSDEASSLEECRRVVQELDDKLDARIVAHAGTKVDQGDMASTKREPAKKVEVANSSESNAVVVIQETIERDPPPIIIIDSGPVESVRRKQPQRPKHTDRSKPPKMGPPYKIERRRPAIKNSVIQEHR